MNKYKDPNQLKLEPPLKSARTNLSWLDWVGSNSTNFLNHVYKVSSNEDYQILLHFCAKGQTNYICLNKR